MTEDYVDAVYMALAAAARTQASAARSPLAWNLRPASWATRKRTSASQRDPRLRRLEV